MKTKNEKCQLQFLLLLVSIIPSFGVDSGENAGDLSSKRDVPSFEYKPFRSSFPYYESSGISRKIMATTDNWSDNILLDDHPNGLKSVSPKRCVNRKINVEYKDRIKRKTQLMNRSYRFKAHNFSMFLSELKRRLAKMYTQNSFLRNGINTGRHKQKFKDLNEQTNHSRGKVDSTNYIKSKMWNTIPMQRNEFNKIAMKNNLKEPSVLKPLNKSTILTDSIVISKSCADSCRNEINSHTNSNRNYAPISVYKLKKHRGKTRMVPNAFSGTKGISNEPNMSKLSKKSTTRVDNNSRVIWISKQFFDEKQTFLNPNDAIATPGDLLGLDRSNVLLKTINSTKKEKMQRTSDSEAQLDTLNKTPLLGNLQLSKQSKYILNQEMNFIRKPFIKSRLIWSMKNSNAATVSLEKQAIKTLHGLNRSTQTLRKKEKHLSKFSRRQGKFKNSRLEMNRKKYNNDKITLHSGFESFKNFSEVSNDSNNNEKFTDTSTNWFQLVRRNTTVLPIKITNGKNGKMPADISSDQAMQGFNSSMVRKLSLPKSSLSHITFNQNWNIHKKDNPYVIVVSPKAINSDTLGNVTNKHQRDGTKILSSLNKLHERLQFAWKNRKKTYVPAYKRRKNMEEHSFTKAKTKWLSFNDSISDSKRSRKFIDIQNEETSLAFKDSTISAHRLFNGKKIRNTKKVILKKNSSLDFKPLPKNSHLKFLVADGHGGKMGEPSLYSKPAISLKSLRSDVTRNTLINGHIITTNAKSLLNKAITVMKSKPSNKGGSRIPANSLFHIHKIRTKTNIVHEPVRTTNRKEFDLP